MKVEIYSKSNCPYCDMAKDFFNSKDIVFTSYNAENVDIFNELMERNPNARTMPQIFINNKLVGGYTDLIKWYPKNIG